jgi:CHAT domain
MKYHNFDLKLFGHESNGYFVEVVSPMTRRSEPASLEVSVELVDHYKSSIKKRLLDRLMWEKVGKTLFQALFPHPIKEIWDRSLGGLPGNHGLRLRLDIRSPALAAIPWEIIHDGDCYLALTPERPVVRYFYDQPEIQTITGTIPVNILLVVATPANLLPLPAVEREIEMICKGVKNLCSAGKVGQVDILRNATAQSLQRKLRQGYQVVHFIGHGTFEQDMGYLMLEDEKGKAQRLDGQTLRYLCREASLLLIFLNSCLGAVPSQQPSLFGTAHAALAAGIPAVVAMQSVIEDELAATFANEFYETLAEGSPLDVCVAEGRKAIMRHVTPERVDWAIPVLFSNANTVMFDFADRQSRRTGRNPRGNMGITTIIDSSTVGQIIHSQGGTINQTFGEEDPQNKKSR